MASLTDEQRALIKANREKALELQKRRLAERTAASTSTAPQIARPMPMTTPQAPRALRPPPNTAPKMTMVTLRPPPPSQTVRNKQLQNGASRPASRPPPAPLDAPQAQKKPRIPLASPLQGYKQQIKVNMVLYNEKSVHVNFEPYHQDVRDALRQFSTYEYIRETKINIVGLSEYSQCTRKLSQLIRVQCTIKYLPPWVLKIFNAEITGNLDARQETVSATKQVDKSLLDKLFKYQLAGLNYGIERNGCIMICDEMGLGKTLQAIAIARAYSNEWPLLVVCPASVKYSWKQSIEEFLPAVDDIHMIDKGNQPFPSSRTCNTVVIMSYEQMAIRVQELVKKKLHVIIFDECHMLKSKEAKRTKAATQLATIAKRKILLSGTPMPSKPIELWSQTQVIDKKLFPNWKTYAERYCDGKIVPRHPFPRFECSGAENLSELHTLLRRTLMIRRSKKEVLHDLPDKLRKVVYLSGNRIDKALDELKKAREAMKLAQLGSDATVKEASIMEYYQQTGVAKSESVAEYIVETYFYNDAPPVKLLIFAHHRVVMNAIAQALEMTGIKYMRIDGGTSSIDRAKYVSNYQQDPDIQVALLSITAAGVGITLTAANKVIFAELHWNPGSLTQAEDRAHRVGQKDSVLVIYILARDTADDEIWPKINAKLQILQAVDLNDETFSSLDNTTRIVDDRPKITDFFDVLDKSTLNSHTLA